MMKHWNSYQFSSDPKNGSKSRFKNICVPSYFWFIFEYAHRKRWLALIFESLRGDIQHMINLRIKHGSTGCRWKFQEDNKCSVTEDPTLTKSGRSCRFLWPKVTLGQRNICLLLPELCLVKSHLALVNKNLNFCTTIEKQFSLLYRMKKEIELLLQGGMFYQFSIIS